MEGQLRDRHSGEVLPVSLSFENGVLLIRPNGYGDFESDENDGYPIMVELYKCSVNVVVYGNINQPEPTNHISLDNAKETARKDL